MTFPQAIKNPAEFITQFWAPKKIDNCDKKNIYLNMRVSIMVVFGILSLLSLIMLLKLITNEAELLKSNIFIEWILIY